MNETLKVAIIGAGQIAGGFDQDKLVDDGGVYTHARAFSDNKNFHLDCIYDLDHEKALNFRKYWNVDHCARSIDEIYGSRYDVVSVCTPDKTHYDITRNLLRNRCCRTIYAEKPIAVNPQDILDLLTLSQEAGVHIVINFQRRFDELYTHLRNLLQSGQRRVLTINGLYMKGLDHSAVAMIDMITDICGYPDRIMSFNRVYNEEINEYSYDFVLYYGAFNVAVKSIDSDIGYTYHIFELDILLSDRRIILNNNSRQCEVKKITDYAYSGVKVLNDNDPSRVETGYKTSIFKATEYLYNITSRGGRHTINTPRQSYNNAIILEFIKESYLAKKLIPIESHVWK